MGYKITLAAMCTNWPRHQEGSES